MRTELTTVGSGNRCQQIEGTVGLQPWPGCWAGGGGNLASNGPSSRTPACWPRLISFRGPPVKRNPTWRRRGKDRLLTAARSQRAMSEALVYAWMAWIHSWGTCQLQVRGRKCTSWSVSLDNVVPDTPLSGVLPTGAADPGGYNSNIFSDLPVEINLFWDFYTIL